jgi:hypothetical protein
MIISCTRIIILLSFLLDGSSILLKLGLLIDIMSKTKENFSEHDRKRMDRTRTVERTRSNLQASNMDLRAIVLNG